MAAAPWVNPAGPIFISHRSTDGTDVAEALARLLRSSGLPVWLDLDDLPPGDIATRLDEAFANGLSGSVLVVTPDVGASAVIRDQELPVLLWLAKNPGFTLAILTEVEDPFDPASYDRRAPARLLDSAGAHPELTTTPGIKQYSRIDLTVADLGQALARRRLEVLRRGRETAPLTIDIQSRRHASAYASTADLVFRTVPPAAGRRLPDPEVWEDLQRLLVWLADVIATERPPEVHLTGGGHLGIGLALGAGLPEAAGAPIAVETVDGVFRRTRRSLSWRERLPFVGVRPRQRWGPRGTGLPLAVYVDVSEFAGLPTFTEWIAANRSAFGRSIVLTRIERHDPERGALIATTIAAAVRGAARKAKASDVLLFLHTSWPLAVLLGAALNTLTVRVFEWDNSSGPPVYVEVVTLRPGIGGSPMIEVHP
jgi:hypothetical protein